MKAPVLYGRLCHIHVVCRPDGDTCEDFIRWHFIHELTIAAVNGLGKSARCVLAGERCASTSRLKIVGHQRGGARTHLFSSALMALTGRLTNTLRFAEQPHWESLSS